MNLVSLLRVSLCRHSVLLRRESAAAVDASRVSLLWKMVRYPVAGVGTQIVLSIHPIERESCIARWRMVLSAGLRPACAAPQFAGANPKVNRSMVEPLLRHQADGHAGL